MTLDSGFLFRIATPPKYGFMTNVMSDFAQMIMTPKIFKIGKKFYLFKKLISLFFYFYFQYNLKFKTLIQIKKKNYLFISFFYKNNIK